MTAVTPPVATNEALIYTVPYPLPVANNAADAPVICSRCNYINHASHHFCTYCGYPIVPANNWLAVYNYRQKQWQKQLYDCNEVVGQARSMLYFIALICSVGAVFVLFKVPPNPVRGSVLAGIALLYYGLGRYSRHRPFTALLLSFLTLISFIAINAWAEYGRIFKTSTGVYLMFIQFVMFYFIFRGVKAAHMAEALEEEYKI